MKLTRNNIAIMEGDQWLSRYVERDLSLTAYDPRIEGLFCPLIPEGGVVIDGGACIGDHTVAYAERVGRGGEVWAFEANWPAFICLAHNTASYRHLPQVQAMPLALADRCTRVRIAQHESNAGASTVMFSTQQNPFKDGWPAINLDRFLFRGVHYMKLDVEGCELLVLQGAEQLIRRHRPIILLETGSHLARYGHSADELTSWLCSLGYALHPVPREVGREQDTVYDVLFKPLV